MIRLASAIAIALLAATPTARSAELSHGPWSVRYSNNGVNEVRFRDTSILEQGSFQVFKPTYKGHLFAMTHATVSTEQDAAGPTLVWAKEQEGVAKVTMRLALRDDRIEWAAQMRVLVDGPVEMGILLPPSAVALPTAAIRCRINGCDTHILEESHPTVVLTRGIDFETARHRWHFRPEASAGRWLFQDFRDTRGLLRIIACLRAKGQEPLEATVRLTLRVREFAQAEAQQREKLFSQRAREYVPVPVADADFDDEPALGSWTHGKNATVVSEGRPPSKRCARITMGSREERGVYLTQRVPVEPGLRYRATALVRTEDVREATVINMKSMGAVLIVEWADKDAKWLAPGRYAKGAFGTKGWHVQRVEDVVAPKGAAYAVIFLGLRGLGTAWFDSVQFFEVRRSAVLLNPLDGVTLRDNRPLLRWRPDPTAKRFRVELSRAPDFAPEDKLVRGDVEEPTFMPVRKLAPARWYWRVGVDGEAASKSWSFEQTAPADADTTGPVVTAAAQAFVSGDEVLRVSVADESAIDPGSLKLLINGSDCPAAIARAGSGWSVRAAKPWPVGASEVEVKLADGAGNVGTGSTWIVRGPRVAEPITWTRDRGVRVGTRHIFPLGIYQVREEDLKRVKDAGFDYVHIYTWEGSQDDAAARAYLDAVHAAGLRAFVGFDRGRSSGNGLVQGNFGMVARRVAALRDHPGLLAWYLFDEPDLAHQYVPPKLVRRYHRFIKALDPDHPVIVTLATHRAIEKYGICWDVYWSMVYRDTAFVAKRLAEHREMLGPECPHMSIVHSYDRAQTRQLKAGEPIDESKFWPDERTLRANALVSVVRGTSGLCWWWFGDHKRQWLATPDVPEIWEAHQRVIAELRRLEPMLVDPGRDAAVTVKCEPGDGQVHARLKVLGAGGLLLVVVNASDKPVAARITSPALKGVARMPVLGQGKAAAVRDGSLTVELDGVDARVYARK